MRIYGWKSKATHYEELPCREVASKTAERMRQKLHCEDVRLKIPPILANGFNKICHCGDESGDVSGCVEDEVQLEVEDKPL